MSHTRAAPSGWSKAPHCILGLGSPSDPIPIYPPDGFAGAAAILEATTRRAMKDIPDWELLAFFLRGPDLVFSVEDRPWFRERWERLVAVRMAARQAAREGARREYFKYLTELRLRWRVPVQRSSGYTDARGRVIPW